MNGEQVSWDDALIRTAIKRLGDQILAMRNAKNKIVPEIDVLRPSWNTEGSKPTIDKLEEFLNVDFEELVKLFEITENKFERARRIAEQMNQIR